MPKIILEGTPGLDGEYDCDFSYLTNREIHEIKKHTGLRAGEFSDAFEAGDNDIIVAFTAIMLARAGKEAPFALLWDLPSGKITIDSSDDEEDDAVPPIDEPDSLELRSSETESSGESSSSSGGHQENGQSPTGPPSLALSHISDRTTSES